MQRYVCKLRTAVKRVVGNLFDTCRDRNGRETCVLEYVRTERIYRVGKLDRGKIVAVPKCVVANRN